MTNCERCCFYAHCAKTGRIKDKNCVYGKKTEEAAEGERYELCVGGIVGDRSDPAVSNHWQN